MGVHKPAIRKDPYVGYQPRAVAAAASACLTCGESAPCMLACSQQVDIRSIIELAGKAACEALALPRWFQSREDVESARLTDMICDSYNS
jgi:hypothetical protein